MAKLKTVWVIHTTANVPNADTEDKFDLVIRASPNPSFVGRLRFPDLPNPDERERAKTDEYRFDVESLDASMDLVDGSDISIEILGSDAWLPSSVWVIGEDIRSVRKLLVGIPDWSATKWWSKDVSEGEPVRLLLP